MRKTLLVTVFVLAVIAGGAVAAEPKLVNEKLVLTDDLDRIINRRSWWRWQLRLSPDGKKLLYTRATSKADDAPAGDRQEKKYQAILHDVATGKESILPISLDRGYRTVPTRFNMFDPASRSLLMYDVHREESPDGGVRSAIKLLRYDIPSGKVEKLNWPGGGNFGLFDATGRNLVVSVGRNVGLASLPDMKIRKLPVQGYATSVSPVGNVIAVFVPGQRIRSDHVRDGGRYYTMVKLPASLILYDTKAEKQIAELPTHEKNSSLDDLAPQWTTDGRYVYYYDVEDAADGSGAKTRSVCRIWDRQAGKPAGKQSDVLAVGAGPTPSSMVLVKKDTKAGEAFLHDGATGTLHRIGGNIQVQHAAGGRIVYVKRDSAGNEGIYVADIDTGDKPKPTKGK